MSAAQLLLSPHRAALIEFNLQPSRHLHAQHWPHYLPEGWTPPADSDSIAHRHVSRLILRKLGLLDRLALDVERPEWPIALAAPALLSAACRNLGLVAIQASVRRIVRRDELKRLCDKLGQEALDFVRQGASDLESADPNLADAPLATVLDRIDGIGCATLAQAFAHAPAPLRERALLRLPLVTTTCGRDPATARALVLRVIQQLDSKWFLSFPAAN